MGLHGPPGTGKTSLCKSLAHKLSIRLAARYKHCSLIEINAHSLFSKWFSESGKLVQKLFAHITEMIEFEDSIVFVLIDEVESLAAARSSAMNGSEPSDSIRAVNALLTQIDKLRQYQNVLVLTTSNISQSIDLAFIDRADLKQFIPNPQAKARYFILNSCVNELLKKKFLFSQCDALFKYEQIEKMNKMFESPIPFAKTSPFGKQKQAATEKEKCSQKLYQIAAKLDGFSGRTLRKLPFITSVYHVESDNCSLIRFLECLEKMAVTETEQREKLKSSKAMDG